MTEHAKDGRLSDDLQGQIQRAKGHLANIRAHGNAEANACLVIEKALDAALRAQPSELQSSMDEIDAALRRGAEIGNMIVGAPPPSVPARVEITNWIIRNLLNESQLSVIPPGHDRPLRDFIKVRE